MDIRIIQRFDVEVLEDAAVRGRMVFGLYNEAAPLGTERFVNFVQGSVGQFKGTLDGPSYRSSCFERLRPGVVAEGGRITGLDLTPFAGQLEYQYRSRLLPLRPVLEVWPLFGLDLRLRSPLGLLSSLRHHLLTSVLPPAQCLEVRAGVVADCILVLGWSLLS